MNNIKEDDNALTKADHLKNEDIEADNTNKFNSCDNNGVTSCTAISTTSDSVTTSKSASSSAQNFHANLWNTFLKSISQQHGSEPKYPNPEVPEFYPRNTISYFNACTNINNSSQTNTTITTTTLPSTKCTAYNTNRTPKKELVSTSQQYFTAATTTDMNLNNTVDPNRNLVRGVAHYYWMVRDTSHYWLPRVIPYQSDQLRIEPALIKPTSSDHFQTELSKKDKQLFHLNNVVKALIEEIWRMNELLMTYNNKEQLKNDLTFAIDELLRPSSEFGFHCDDCCDKFKHVIIKMFKQQERKTAKQLAQNKDIFINYLVSVIENSLQAFSKCGHVRCDFEAKSTSRPTKHDATTQTEPANQEDRRKPYRRPDTRKSKHQATKIYRNRNFYKGYDVLHSTATLDGTHWYPATMSNTSFNDHQTQNDKSRHKLIKHFQPKVYSYLSHSYKTTSKTAAIQQPTLYELQATNPIQLIHQKYKNLSCRLEGIPDKNLIKFSYIVNGKEYSAIASTKKEAQYLCAWHVLAATKYK